MAIAKAIDQSYALVNQTQGVSLRLGATTSVKLAQAFVPAVSGYLVQFDWSARKVGSPTGNLFTSIFTDDGNGLPSTTQVGSTSANSDVSALAGTNPPTAWNNHTWATGRPYLTKGVTYWAVIEGDYTPSATDLAQIFRAAVGTYPSNSAKRDAGWTLLTAQDFVFQEWISTGDGVIVGKKVDTGISSGTRLGGI